MKAGETKRYVVKRVSKCSEVEKVGKRGVFIEKYSV